MMSSEQIVALSREAARRSAREGVYPLIVTEEHLETDLALKRRLRATPFIGNRIPRGWKRLNASALLGSDRGCVPLWSDSKERYHFIEVDSSGLGTPGELALTFEEFLAAVRKIGPGYGYAMIEQGQFQVVIAVYKPRS